MAILSSPQRMRWLAVGTFLLISFHRIMRCPHSKVEESFGIQAVHDLFYHGLAPAFLHQQQELDTPLPYDHLQYPGVVPRSFIGPFLLSGLSQAIRWVLVLLTQQDLAQYPMITLLLARTCLLLLTAHAFFRVTVALDRCNSNSNNKSTKSNNNKSNQWLGNYFLLISSSQFHIPFYASRMLANTWAMIGTSHALACVLQDQIPAAVMILVATTVIFRCDVILLLGSWGLLWLLTRQLTMVRALTLGIPAMVVSLLLSVPLDSLLWQQPWLWPEGQVLYFNTILGKSVDYGISAWHWYWTSALPKTLLLTVVLLPWAFLRMEVLEKSKTDEREDWSNVTNRTSQTTVCTGKNNTSGNNKSSNKNNPPISRYVMFGWGLDTTWLPLLIPAVGFVVLYSCLGHKEVRFLFPILPLWNVVIAAGMYRLHLYRFHHQEGSRTATEDESYKDKPRSENIRRKRITVLLYSGGLATIVLSFIASCIFVEVSHWNYPGGAALQTLIHHLAHVSPNDVSTSFDSTVIHVHVDVAAAMTGVSLFGQREAQNAVAPYFQLLIDKAGYEAVHASHIASPQQGLSFSSSSSADTYTHLLTEINPVNGFHIVATIQGNPRLDWKRGRILTSNAIFVLERNGWLESK